MEVDSDDELLLDVANDLVVFTADEMLYKGLEMLGWERK